MASNGRRVDPDGLPAIQEEVDVIELFRTYQESCRMRLDACGDDPGLRLGALQPLVNELLEQNEMLIQSISQLQQERKRDMCHKPIDSPQDTGERSAKLQQVTGSMPDAGHVSASEVIRELNTHLTSLQIENNFLRDKNDNLEHDIENLLDMIDFERNVRSARDGMPEHASDAKVNGQSIVTVSGLTTTAPTDTTCKLLTFCDSLTPEDVYGPIESHSTSIPIPIDCLVAGNERREENEAGDSEEKTSHSLKSLDDGSSTGKDSGVSSDTNSTAVIKSDNMNSRRKQTISTSSCSLASTNLQLVLEEKDLLIADLQQHLESLTRQVHLSDDVIKKIEVKLSDKRKECTEWRGKAFDWQRKLNDHIKENMDLKERILTLNDHKRCLMTRLDEQSEACQLANEELVLLRRRSSQLLQQNEFQTMTIEHLKEAIISKTRALSGISSSTPSLTRLHRNSTMQL